MNTEPECWDKEHGHEKVGWVGVHEVVTERGQQGGAGRSEDILIRKN